MENSKHSLFRLFGLLLLLLLFDTMGAQELIITRKISLIKGDTTVVAGILANVKVEETRSDVFYHWYGKDNIHRNQGGYSGDLLHGPYVEYNSRGSMILKGSFEQGLKCGSWISWYGDGFVSERIEFKEGLLDGENTRYAPDGRILFSAVYRDNQLHGKVLSVESDTLFRIRYRKGRERRKTELHVFSE